MKANHARRFFKEVTRLEDVLYDIEDVDGGIDTWAQFAHEAHEVDCIKRDDGLWETKPETYGRKIRKFVFLWRDHPNYCCAGQPIYTSSDAMDFLEKSETEKVLYTFEDYKLSWARDQVVMPTRIIWGMKLTGLFYRLTKNDEILFETDVKSHFNDMVKEYIA